MQSVKWIFERVVSCVVVFEIYGSQTTSRDKRLSCSMKQTDDRRCFYFPAEFRSWLQIRFLLGMRWVCINPGHSIVSLYRQKIPFSGITRKKNSWAANVDVLSLTVSLWPQTARTVWRVEPFDSVQRHTDGRTDRLMMFAQVQWLYNIDLLHFVATWGNIWPFSILAFHDHTGGFRILLRK